MPDTYEYGPVFRERICALTLIPDWFARYGTIISPEYFETEEERKFIKFTKHYYDQYQATPEHDEAGVYFDNDSEMPDFLNEVYDIAESGNLKFAEDEIITFAKQQAMKLAILQSVDDLKSGDLAKPLTRVEEAQLVGRDMTDLGMDLKEPDDWLYHDPLNEVIPTGIQHLDEQFGGISRGEYGLIMTTQGVGKTMTLINIGCGAASITSRCNVVHITLEMSAKKIMRRYAARITGRFLTKEADQDEYRKEFDQFSKMKIRGNIKATRSAINAELVDLDHIAEDISKVATADVVITGSQTKEEYNEGLIRYYAAKIREGPKNWVVRCKQDHKAHAITSIDVMSVSAMLEEKRKRKDDMKNDRDIKDRLKAMVKDNE
jgi:KaiC/GvpD/RAD55 family RecA-like ATPase